MSEGDNPIAASESSDQDVSTAAQYRQREVVDKAQQISSSNDIIFCLQAQIDVLSQIITIDPAESFTLLQLCGAEESIRSSVVGLNCHTSILPGDAISYHRA